MKTNRVMDWIRSKRDRLNSFAPIFFSSYFLLLVLPYCTGRIPVLYSLICVNVIGRVIFRLLPTAYLLIYGALVGIANRSRFRWEWAIPMLLLWLGFGLAWIFTPDSYSYVSTSWDRSITYSTTTVGWLDTAIAFGTLIAETTILLFWISFFPDAVRSKVAIKVPLFVIVGFSWLAIILSIAIEWKLYVSLFRGGDHKLIHSIFFQKNEFGAFLFMGTFSSSFLAYFSKGKLKWVWFVSAFLLTVFTFLVRCYTAFASELVVVIALAIGYLLRLRKKRKALTFGILAVSIFVIGLTIGLSYIEPVRETVAPLRILYNSLTSIEKEILTRTVIWQHLYEVATGHQVFLGVTDRISDAKLASLQIVEGEAAVAIFHNSYIAYLAIHGLLGLLIYFAIVFKAVRHCSRFGRKAGIVTMVFLFALLIGYLLQGMAETYVLFIKMSVLTLPLTYVFMVFVPSMGERAILDV